MIFDNQAEMKAAGFMGFVPIEQLMSQKCTQVPKSPGVYFVVRPSDGPPKFLPSNPGGRFKGKNPTVSVDDLRARWVPKSQVVYIGKAGGGDSNATLRSRLSQYMRFGQGEPVGHWGGRLIWQLDGHRNLLVCWKVEADARRVESLFLERFMSSYGALPFANLTR